VLSTPDGNLHVRSAAVLRALEEIGGIWTFEAKLGRLIPTALRDRLYDAIARARHRWFEKPETACPLMPPDLRVRFRD
jgi:predicted DCC family thiol-disulfide oxidoreductase YuxK